MHVTLNQRQSAKIAAALRRGSIDALRIADAIDPAGQTHFLIEVTDMGQFAKDWAQLKTLIRQKDDAIDKQAAQIAALQKQVSAQQPALDADDQKAVAELHQTIGSNTASAPAAAVKSTTTAAAAPTNPQAPAVTTFVK
ncbi:MAG TPA: hypothetical protein VG326_08500 [Tepidisphaeraceae bacterium]|jgi:hypothetical protein|nr:hypothetical protein [Tepidisphaeraceae bacterium]